MFKKLGLMVAILLVCFAQGSFAASHNKPVSKKNDVAQQQQLTKTIKQIIHYYNQHDLHGLNQFIHPDVKLFITFEGLLDFYQYERVPKLKKHIENIPDFVLDDLKQNVMTEDFPVTFLTKRKTRCNEAENPAKKGLFVTVHQRQIEVMSGIFHFYKLNDDNYDSADEKLIKQITPRTVKVTYRGKGKDESDHKEYQKFYFTFHLTLINHKWYLTVLELQNECCGEG